MSEPMKMYWTYPNVHHMCVGCEALMNFEKIQEPPRMRVTVHCINPTCEFYNLRFELLPTLMKPYVDTKKEKLIAEIYQ